MILTADVGATNTRLAIFDDSREKQMLAKGHYSNRQHSSLSKIIMTFLQEEEVRRPTRAVIGVAGPVHAGRSHATNIPWIIDVRELEKELQIESIVLINDLEAHAWGIHALTERDLRVLHKGDPKLRGNAAVIAAGTGLGEAGLFWDGQHHIPFACEGGHCDFGPRDELEIELLRYAKQKFGHVSWERIVSGPGISMMYQFLIESNYEQASRIVKQEMETKDPTAVIVEWGKNGQDSACIRSVNWFLSLYGAETGNLALKMLAIGGIYVCGTVANEILKKIDPGPFVGAFLDKGRFAGLLGTIPIYQVINEEAPLLGALEYLRAH